MIKISVITVCLNMSKTIERTIQSVIQQEYGNMEYIVIDGGSDDGTTDIINKYIDKIDVMISERDEGTYYAMNKGLGYAKGEYVLFLNADDWLVPNVISRAVEFMEFNEADVYYGNTIITGKGKNQRSTADPIESINWQMPFCHQAVFMRNTGEERFDENYRIVADYDLFINLYYQGYRFCYLPMDIVFFSLGGISDSAKKGDELAEISSMAFLKYKVNNRLFHNIVINKYIRNKYKLKLERGEDIDIFIRFLNDTIRYPDRIILFGSGDIVSRYRNVIESISEHIKFFVDNDEHKWGKELYGKQILSPEQLKKETDVSVVLMSDIYYSEMREQLLKMILDNSIEIFVLGDLVDAFLSQRKDEMCLTGEFGNDSINKLYRAFT